MTERISRLWALIKKEFLTILRDPKSRIIIIAPPLIQLALFANILTMETKNADIAVIDASNTLESREFVAGMRIPAGSAASSVPTTSGRRARI